MEPFAFSHKTFLAFAFLCLSCLLVASAAPAQDLGGTEIAPLPSITVKSATEGFQGSLESGDGSEWPAAVQ